MLANLRHVRLATRPVYMTRRIAFNVLGDSKWRAGTVNMVDLLAALRQTYGEKLGLYLLAIGQGEPLPDELTQWVDDHLLYPWPRRWTPAWAYDGIMRRLLGQDTNGTRFLRRLGIDVQALGFLRGHSPIPVVGWLPDFQHRHMPELFTDEGHLRARRARPRHRAVLQARGDAEAKLWRATSPSSRLSMHTRPGRSRR